MIQTPQYLLVQTGPDNLTFSGFLILLCPDCTFLHISLITCTYPYHYTAQPVIFITPCYSMQKQFGHISSFNYHIYHDTSMLLVWSARVIA